MYIYILYFPILALGNQNIIMNQYKWNKKVRDKRNKNLPLYYKQ